MKYILPDWYCQNWPFFDYNDLLWIWVFSRYLTFFISIYFHTLKQVRSIQQLDQEGWWSSSQSTACAISFDSLSMEVNDQGQRQDWWTCQIGGANRWKWTSGAMVMYFCVCFRYYLRGIDEILMFDVFENQSVHRKLKFLTNEGKGIDMAKSILQSRDAVAGMPPCDHRAVKNNEWQTERIFHREQTFYF